MTDLMSLYLEYTADTEAPTHYHRWSFLSMLATLCGRRAYFKRGRFTIYPNLYIMLIGVSGCRKSTPIKMAKKLLKTTGYKTIAADKTTKEKFLLDLEGLEEDQDSFDLFDSSKELSPDADSKEMYIIADEWNDFAGLGNMEFFSMLGSLWDYEGMYEFRLKNSKSVHIPNPTVNILSGNTPTNFSACFPPETLGQGFLGRLLLVHGEPTGRKIAFPKEPDPKLFLELQNGLAALDTALWTVPSHSKEAADALEEIYNSFESLEDPRFDSYCTRRFNQLIKLSVIYAASRISTRMELGDVIRAHTTLCFAEHFMPKALGEFGKSYNAEVVDKVMNYIHSKPAGSQIKELWKIVQTDLKSVEELMLILNNLILAEKVIGKDSKYFPCKLKGNANKVMPYVDFSILTREELKFLTGE